jgi:GNAT superfamily N-acetyltransferase
MQSPPLLRVIEECSLNAWPGLQQLLLDGWLVRFGAGFTRRANSVTPLYAGTGEVRETLARCEALYAARGQPCIVRITPLAQPPGLEALLEHAGYRREGETSVQVLDPLPDTRMNGACALADALSDHWHGTFTRLDDTPVAHRHTLRAILGQIALPHTGALCPADATPVCCGRAVLEGPQLGLFDIATDAAQRGRGHATRLIGHLLAWGRRLDATRAYLQVEVDNAPALRLYAHLGFRELYRYWYRVK